MDRNRFKQVEDIYHTVLATEPHLREDALIRFCNGDAAAIAQLRSLIGFDQHRETIMDRPPADVAAEVITGVFDSVYSGKELFGYKIISKIGEGGMGAVFLAEDMRLRRRPFPHR